MHRRHVGVTAATAAILMIGLLGCGDSGAESRASTVPTGTTAKADAANTVANAMETGDGLRLADGGTFSASLGQASVKAASSRCVDVKRSATALTANDFGDDWVHLAVAQAGGTWEVRGAARPGDCAGNFATLRAADAIHAAIDDGTLSANAVIVKGDPLPDDYLSKLVAWRVDGQKICLAPSNSKSSDDVVLAWAQESGRAVEKPESIQIVAPAGEYCEPRPSGVTSPTLR